eukprot:3400971-Alexandrium_andersonii.AAC.1
MGPGGTCLLVNWHIRPTNNWSGTLGATHPARGELSAGPGPNTTALPWRVAACQANGEEVQFWAGIGSHCGVGSGQQPVVTELCAG